MSLKKTRIITVPMENRADVNIPVCMASGQADGPCLLAVAGEHGSELSGVAAIDRVFRELNTDELAGTFIGVPAVNPPNVISRSWPEGSKNKELWDSFEAWPGDSAGTPAERITSALTRELVNQADVVINFHSWSRSAAGCIFTSALNEQAKALSKFFELPFVHYEFSHYCRGAETPLRKKSNMLTHYALAHGITAMLVELPAHNFLEHASVKAGINGLMNIMKQIKMLPGAVSVASPPLEALDEDIVNAPHEGLFIPLKELGQKVCKNELLGYVLNMNTGEQTNILCPVDGAVWTLSRVGQNTQLHAYADKGDMLAIIKTIKENVS